MKRTDLFKRPDWFKKEWEPEIDKKIAEKSSNKTRTLSPNIIVCDATLSRKNIHMINLLTIQTNKGTRIKLKEQITKIGIMKFTTQPNSNEGLIVSKPHNKVKIQTKVGRDNICSHGEKVFARMAKVSHRDLYGPVSVVNGSKIVTANWDMNLDKLKNKCIRLDRDDNFGTWFGYVEWIHPANKQMHLSDSWSGPTRTNELINTIDFYLEFYILIKGKEKKYKMNNNLICAYIPISYEVSDLAGGIDGFESFPTS